MNRERFTPYCSCLLLALFLGCVGNRRSDYPSVTVHTARIADIQVNKTLPVTGFGAQERMAAVVKNLTSENQVLMVEFVRPESGLVVSKIPLISLPKILNVVTPNAPLPEGNYIVRVIGTGIQPATCSFAIYGR
jgi:hypothetical protein